MTDDKTADDESDIASQVTSETVVEQGDAVAEQSQPQQAPIRKRQKRNKPTLSCGECVERKTKCDRNRPSCWACIKRQSACRYSEIAEIIASAAIYNSASNRKTNKVARHGKPSVAERSSHAAQPPSSTQKSEPAFHIRPSTSQSYTSLPLLLSNLPYPVTSPSKILGEGSEHPVSNYWSHKGGLPEVIGVLPSKDQADVLVQTYFEAVDAVYPIINKTYFLAEYDRFWALPPEQKNASEPAILGLHFVVYAMGTQFIEMKSDQERRQIAEFYASAAHQCLRISSYLNRGSFSTVQTLVMLCYFLMNDNKASDAWGFGGILVRHVYAMGLNRDPEAIVPEASVAEKQLRRKLWQAVLFQDTFLTVLLRLPPTTTFTDVDVDSLIDDPDVLRTPSIPESSPPINPMSIRSIAPSPAIAAASSSLSPPPTASSNDCSYIRTMWKLANFVQSRICTPRALGHPLVLSSADKVQTVAQFQSLFDSLPPVLTTPDQRAFFQLVSRNPRQARQNLFARSNYWHCVMQLQVDESARYNVHRDFEGAIAAARMAMLAFFNLWDAFRIDAGVWWVFQHRAFEEALTVAELLGAPVERMDPGASPSARRISSSSTDSLIYLAKQDVIRVLEILEHVGSTAPDMQKSRTDVLRRAVESMRY